MADPGIPVGGADPVDGALTLDMAKFRKKLAHPLDPPLAGRSQVLPGGGVNWRAEVHKCFHFYVNQGEIAHFLGLLAQLSCLPCGNLH